MEKNEIHKRDIEKEILKLQTHISFLEDELKLTALKMEGFKIRLKELNHQ